MQIYFDIQTQIKVCLPVEGCNWKKKLYLDIYAGCISETAPGSQETQPYMVATDTQKKKKMKTVATSARLGCGQVYIIFRESATTGFFHEHKSGNFRLVTYLGRRLKEIWKNFIRFWLLFSSWKTCLLMVKCKWEYQKLSWCTPWSERHTWSPMLH